VPGPVDLTDEDLELRLIVRPHGKEDEQTIRRVALWLDDYRYDSDKIALDRSGQLNVAITLPGSMLRRGLNRLTLQAVNKAGNRGQAEVQVRYASRRPIVRGKLVGLCVGVNDYRTALRKHGVNVKDLRCSEADADAVARVLRDHKNSHLFEDVEVPEPLKGAAVTPQAIQGWLRKLEARKWKREDCLVLFLSGHGHSERDAIGAHVPDSFAFVCADSDKGKPFLPGRELAESLARLPCRKLILLDACHSGGLASNPIRALTASGIPVVILSACQPDESALEPEDVRDGKHGFFTQALLGSVGGEVAGKAVRTVPVTGEELVRTVQQGIQKQITQLKTDLRQTPVFYPETLLQEQLLCRQGR
jgi:hypothetical protein